MRDLGSVQPLPPTSRRASQQQQQQQQQQRDVNGGHNTPPHPYATPPNGYRAANALGRHSPNPVSQLHMNGGSESFLYGHPKNGEETTIADPGGPVRGFDQMQRVGVGVGERGEDGGHGRKGFWSNLCC